MRIAHLVAMLIALPTASAEPLSGIAGVVDGDTIAIGSIKIRLEGIDCPEAGQTCQHANGDMWACGAAATEMTIALADRKQVTCEITGQDRFGRQLGICHADGAPEVSINGRLVRAGLAYAFRRYSRRYVADEEIARDAKVGVWSGANEPPWEYRKRLKRR
jgi:endonuclease YncB( thermonuclease family)